MGRFSGLRSRCVWLVEVAGKALDGGLIDDVAIVETTEIVVSR